MAGIPSSAIKIYNAPSGGTEVTSGLSGATVYARLISSFIETLTGLNKTITFPYSGRVSISGTKTFTSNGDSKTLTVQLPAYGLGHQDAGSLVGRATGSITSGTAAYAFATGISCSKSAQSFAITFYSNSPGISIYKSTSAAWLTINSMTVNAVSAPVDGSEYTVPSDTGQVLRYAVVVNLTVSANNDLTDRNEDIVFDEDTVTFMVINVVQASQGIILSTSSVNVDASTGLSNTAITVTSDSTFTVS